ncbi:hypothetical protein ACLMJK_000100 [Lecanora helva]
MVGWHSPNDAQNWSLAQQSGPHGDSPYPESQLNDDVAAAAETASDIELGGAEAGVNEDGLAGGVGSGSLIPPVWPSKENLSEDASQQLVPPLNSGRFVSQQ